MLTLPQAMAEIAGRAARQVFYVYTLLRPDGQPFYVGMGKGRRIAYHERVAAAGAKGHKSTLIRKLQSGDGVRYVVEFFSDRAAAVAREVDLIALLGRRDRGAGPLLNATAGGEGAVDIFGNYIDDSL